MLQTQILLHTYVRVCMQIQFQNGNGNGKSQYSIFAPSLIELLFCVLLSGLFQSCLQFSFSFYLCFGIFISLFFNFLRKTENKYSLKVEIKFTTFWVHLKTLPTSLCWRPFCWAVAVCGKPAVIFTYCMSSKLSLLLFVLAVLNKNISVDMHLCKH